MQLTNVREPLLGTNDLIASFQHHKNGNRKRIFYSMDGTSNTTVHITYNYNRDNMLTDFATTDGPTYSFDATDSGDLDGLGRLINASETLTKTDNVSTVTYNLGVCPSN